MHKRNGDSRTRAFTSDTPEVWALSPRAVETRLVERVPLDSKPFWIALLTTPPACEEVENLWIDPLRGLLKPICSNERREA